MLSIDEQKSPRKGVQEDMLGKTKQMKGFDYKYQHTADLNDVIIVIRGYNCLSE